MSNEPFDETSLFGETGVEFAGPDDYLIDVDGDVVIPSDLCGGPWSPDAQHGSAVAAILGRAIETVETPVPMRPARFTVDLLSPVPLEPMRQVTRVVKAGKRIAVVDAELHHGNRLAARATCLLMRDGARYPVADAPGAPPDLAPPPTEASEPPFGGADPDDLELPGFARAMHFTRTRGTHLGGVPAAIWIGLRCRVARDEPLTPFQLAATASDMGSILGGFLDFREWRTINADITMHLLRLPVGDSIGLDGEFRADPGGVGMSASTMFDTGGLFARMTSSTFIDRWGE